MSELANVKVGDVIATRRYGAIDSLHTVVKTTPAQVWTSERNAFWRKSGKPVGYGGSYSWTAFVPTAEQVDMLQRRDLATTIRATDERELAAVPLETLRAFMDSIAAANKKEQP